MFGDLAVLEPENINACHRDALASGRKPHERPLIGAFRPETSHDLVTFHNPIFNRDMQIGKGAPVHAYHLSHSLETGQRIEGIMIHKGWSKEFINQLQVSLIKDTFIPAAGGRLIVYC